MKKLIYLFIATTFLVSCSDDDMATAYSDSGWIDFQTSSSNSTGSEGEVMLPVNVNLGTNLAGQTIQYSVSLVSGNVSTPGILGTFSALIPSGEKIGYLPVKTSLTDGNYELLVTLLSSDAMYDMGLIDGSKIDTHTIYLCPINLSATFTGVDVIGAAGPAPVGYTSNVTALGNNMYSLDTSWGPDYISATCGGCVPPGDYVAPITISIDPITLDVTVISGGEPSGSGNTFDIDYTVGGSGTYDSCNDTLSLNLTDNDIFGPSVSVVLQGN